MNSTHDAEIIHVNVINTQLQYSNKTDLQSNFFRNKLKRNLTQSRLWLTLTGKFRKMPCHIAQIYAPSKANTANVRMFSPFNVVYDCLIHYIRLFLITKLNFKVGFMWMSCKTVQFDTYDQRHFGESSVVNAKLTQRNYCYDIVYLWYRVKAQQLLNQESNCCPEFCSDRVDR